MGSKHQQLRHLLTDAIVELCRKEAFYVEELRIEGTVCLVSDRSSVMIAQITEQIGDQFGSGGDAKLPVLNTDQADELAKTKPTTQAKTSDTKSQDKTDNDCNNQDQQDQTATTTMMGVRQSPQTQGPTNQGKRKYKCPFCPKSYNFKHSLKDHINKHTGRKPHVCKHCSMSFTHFGSLCAHIKRQHYHQLSVDFQCSLCQERFMSDQSLKQHFTWRHKGIAYMGPATTKSQSPGRTVTVGQDQSQDALGTKETMMDIEDGSTERLDIKQELGNGATERHNVKDETDFDGSSRDSKDRKTTEGVSDIVQTFIRMLEGERSTEQQRQQREQQQQQLLQQHQQQQQKQSQMATCFPVSSANSPLVPGVTPGQWDAVTSLSSMGLQGFPAPSTSVTAGVVPGTSNPTLEMLAHMAQMTQGVMTHGLNPITSLAQHPPPGFHPMLPPPHMRAKTPQDFQRSADGKFQCPYCEKTYNFKHTLKDHINKHLGNRPHVCKHCGDSFTHLASLCAHIKRRHDNQMTSDYQCELCHEKFMNLQSLKQHFTWRHKDVKFSPRKFLESSKGAVPLNADPEPASSNSHPNQSLHSNTSTNSLTHQASLQPATQSVPRDHGMSHEQPMSHDAMTYSQSHTDQSTVGSQSAADNHLAGTQIQQPHITLSDSIRQPQFPGSVQAFSPPPSIAIPSPEDELIPIPEDDEDTPPSIYIAEYFSEVNLQTQHGFYKYKCKICGNMFKIRNSLYEHLNSHLGKKPYTCAHCGDAFTHHSTLHNHVRNKHSFQSREEREAQFKHVCDSCGKKFRYPSELDRHFKSNPDHDGTGKAKLLQDVMSTS